MTIRVNRLPPEVLLGTPRRSAATASPDGKYVVYSSTSYSFATHSKSSEICVMNVSSGEKTVISKDVAASEPNWLGEDYKLVWLRQGGNGNTAVIVADATKPGTHYTAGTVSGPVSSLKLYHIKSGMVALAVAGLADPDGSLHNPQNASQAHSTARVYDSLFVRHWDTFTAKQQNSIFTGLLQESPSGTSERAGRFSLFGFTNALAGTKLECPIAPFGGTDHFDIGPKGLVIVAKDPELDPALHTRCRTYVIPRKDLMDLSPVSPIELKLQGFEGAATSPVWSPDGKSVAYLKMKADKYEADRNWIVAAFNVGPTNTVVNDLINSAKGFVWDRSPSSLTWSSDGRRLYLVAEHLGAGCLFELNMDAPPSGVNPRQLTFGSTITDVVPAGKDSRNLLLSSSSFIDNSTYTLFDPTLETEAFIISSSSDGGSLFGLSSDQVRSFWWLGDNKHSVHAWVIVPSFFDPKHKYPLAYLIHGGPQGAWNDSWSTRWNPAVFAEQGYVVVCPNPTGSTGYGQAFTDAIQANWGGSPYIDLVKGFEYMEKECPYIDTSRAVALGASYGGYMMNWLQGQPLGRKFKALVCHDGVFSLWNQISSDEIYFPSHEFGGPPWVDNNQATYDKWDPSRHLKHWSTPMLVVHSDRDYRLPVSEGLAAFNVLQWRGIESRFLNFPDENHWVLKQENSLVWHLVVLNWINKFAGLPKVVDQDGRDGEEYLRREKGPWNSSSPSAGDGAAGAVGAGAAAATVSTATTTGTTCTTLATQAKPS